MHRYIPKIKEISYGSSKYNFTEPINMTTLTYPSGFSVDLTTGLWDSESAPDRQVDYMMNASSEICASFAGGYLPIADGEIEKRSQNINAAGFVYNTKKTYPYFVDSKAFGTSGTKNQKITGVAYKKYNGAQDSDINYYTVPYGKDTYVYIDCHEKSKKEIDLSYLIDGGVKVSEIEKMSNVSYSINNGKISVEMKDGTYGFLVLKIASPDVQPVGIVKNVNDKEVVAKIKNNTHETATVNVLVATYSGKQLKEIKVESLTIKDFETYRHKENFENLNGDEKIKVFVWDGIGTLNPISSNFEE